MAAEENRKAGIEISLKRVRADVAPDVYVGPAQLHVKPGTYVTWSLKHNGSFTIAFKGAPHWLKVHSGKSVVSLEVPDDAPPGTYSYAVEGTAELEEKQPVRFNILGCPEIIIQ